MREPATWVIRARSAQSFFSIRATWSSGSKSKLGGLAFAADDGVEGLVRADRRAFPGNVGHAQQQRVERRLLLGEAGFEPPKSRAPIALACCAERRPLLGRRALEAVADLVALPAQLVDPRLHLAHLAVERQQRVEIERDVLVGDRLGDGLGIVTDEAEAEHQAEVAARGQNSSAGTRRSGAETPPCWPIPRRKALRQRQKFIRVN